MNPGVVLALAAYLLWGAFPLYFMLVKFVPTPEMLAHRVLWSLAFVAILLTFAQRWAWLPKLVRQPRTLRIFALSAALLSINWGLYFYAVSHGRIVDASLGYFINPLVSVLLGSIVLHERLRAPQWVAVAFAAAGVCWLTWLAGDLPWIGLAIAATFAIYGLLRKTAPLPSMEGLALETLMLTPMALGYVVWLSDTGDSTFASSDSPWSTLALLALSGPVTSMPLLLFAAAARRIQLSTLGVIQYIAPSMQFLLAVFLFHEPFDGHKAAGYVAIWTGLAIFTGHALWTASRPAQPGAGSPIRASGS
jgi:chloramphenicol-sensitive protein RarD